MKKTLLAASFGCIVGSVQAAESPQWDRVGLSYQSVDTGELTFTGLGVTGTKLLGEDVFIAGSFGRLSDDFEFLGHTAKFEYSPLSVGLGVRKAVAPNIDVFGEVSYEDGEFKVSYQGDSEKDSENGYGLTAGVRAMVTPSLELAGSISYVDLEESDTSVGVSAHYYFTDQFSLGVAYGKSDDVDGTGLIAAFYF